MKTMTTAVNNAAVTKIWGTNFSNRIKIKNIITPRVMVQKHSSMMGLLLGPSIFFSISKTRDRVIKDNGNEYPRKKVSRVNLSMCTQWVYSLFMITTDARAMPMDRHHKDAW